MFSLSIFCFFIILIIVIYYMLYKPYRRRFAKNEWSLSGKVIVVTGGSRGIGKGVATELGRNGCTVYLTGRTVVEGEGPILKGSPLEGTITETAQIINQSGGHGIAVQCDHNNDDDMRALVERIKKEQDGRGVDCLVNNVIWIRSDVKQSPPFWQQEIEVFDAYHRVGLRSHYVMAVLLMPLLETSATYHREKLNIKFSPIIVNISSPGAKHYLFNCAYGSAKAALDRLTSDMAVDLRKSKSHVVACGLWPGMVKTERMQRHANTFKRMFHVNLMEQGETPEFTGRAIAAMIDANDAQAHNGKILTVAGLADRYNFDDVNGRRPPSMTDPKFIAMVGWNKFKALFSKQQQN
mmetsp:Transcript_14218/g.21318  ORF Transcript_14218/g.21318 Transcript_14218/m.21318 type:complete len:351 (-) Transcript_14218:3-1055(-)